MKLKVRRLAALALLPLTLAVAGQTRADEENCGTACKADTGACCAKQEVEHASITPDGLKVLLQAGTPAVLLDARSGKYDDGRRVPGAKALNAKSSADDAAKAIPSKESLVVTYCANEHCPASRLLAAHLRTLGYKNILEMREGIEGWVKAGNETTKEKQL